jgi:peptidoglycan/LPS O-acetylase OafA/YrhL
MKNKTFFPHLDALRFLAFFAVFVNHALISFGYYNPNPTFKFIQKNFLSNGGLGVSFFFVLSGFLITYLLLEEKEHHGRIDIKKFYIRRILRIWPLYFLIVLLSLFIFPLFKDTVPANFPIRFATNQLNPWLYVTFAGNFDYLWNGISNVLIGVLWSVSIEEQFYLFWPLIIAFVPKKGLLPTFILIILASTLFRFFYTNGGSLKIITYHSFSCVSDLAIGALLAYLCTNKKFTERIERMPGLAIEGIYFAGFALLPFREYIWKFGVHYVHAAAILPVLVAAFFAFVIMEQCYARHSFFKAGNLKMISKLGTYSYGLYCYHMTVFCIVLMCYSLAGFRITGISPYQLVITSCISLLLTIGISKLSYIYFEKKFLDLKKKFDTD